MTRNIISGPELFPLEIQEGLSLDRKINSFIQEIEEFNGNVFLQKNQNLIDEDFFTLYNFEDYIVCVHNTVHELFFEKFKTYLDGNNLYYDNLINLCIMVKDAGEDFRNILRSNLPYIDRYTILDTGSTDNTVQIIKEELASKRGELYEEPFINFRDSRNRLLDLAETHCFFNLMLDDSYVVNGDLRKFLDLARGDDKVDSFSLTLEDIETMYTSNRVTKSDRGLRYINLVHEIIDTKNNLNVMIPKDVAYIKDITSSYMNQRTSNRKLQDIETLMKMLEEDPDDPRTYYYIADSYIFMKDWEKALEWFTKRVEKGGYEAEIQDSLYYIAVLKDKYLNYPWKECHDCYLKCFEQNPKRAESLYFIAEHYINSGMLETGMLYLKQAYNLGMPEISMSVRKDIYQIHIPTALTNLCYSLGDYKLGEEVARKVLQYKHNPVIDNWLKIYYYINNTDLYRIKTRFSEKNLIVFVSPGGWKEWDGETLRLRGLGGSENFSIRYGEKLADMGFDVIIFCNCEKEKLYNGVKYLKLDLYPEFISTYNVDIAIINRYHEYVPVTCLHNIKTYFVLHDTARENDIIINHKNLAGVLCLSDWHKQNFLEYYPSCHHNTSTVSYGLDITEYPQIDREEYMFIYPNFPNRGLVHLLRMWPKILQKYPTAKLHTFCNTKNNWCQQYWKQDMDEIDRLLIELKDTVIDHGWVNGSVLREYWAKAHVWFYPCTFKETCCLTAWEAAASKTLAVTNHLAALKESVGDRGLIIDGDASTVEWQDQALDSMFNVIDNGLEQDFITRNYDWICTKNFDNVVGDLVRKFV